MKNTGQTSLEFLLVMAAALSMYAFLLTLAVFLEEQHANANALLLATAESKKCSTTIDTMYTTSGTKTAIQSEKCTSSKPHQVSARVLNREKNAFTIAPEISTVQTGDKTILEVKISDHYTN